MNTQQIITSVESHLATFFADQDAKIAEADVVWALARKAALKAFDASDEGKALAKRGAWGGIYEKRFEICGGKSWYQLFSSKSDDDIATAMRQNAEATAKARNAKLAAKLIKAGVTEVFSADVVFEVDGFRGTYKVNGNRFVDIRSILAGGPVQRLHQRVLCNVR